MAAYYNEFDKKAAQWLRNLISAGLIAPGDVDDRSIIDVSPDDLRGYTQCHFFAGIGVWSHALRRAGWRDDKPVWTMSCPCQPFSAAGATAGFADERHLWPYAAWLIEQCGPPVVFGEQVANKAVEPWVDLVHADMEAMVYAFGAVPFPSASVGAPHIRDRIYWVGERLADASSVGLQGGLHRRPDTQWQIEHGSLGRLRSAVGVANTERQRHDGSGDAGEPKGSELGRADAPGLAVNGWQQPGKNHGLWDVADWLHCQDGKWRPVESGTLPLANGAPARVVRLRAYGNAINAEQATVFIQAYQEAQARPANLIPRDEYI